MRVQNLLCNVFVWAIALGIALSGLGAARAADNPAAARVEVATGVVSVVRPDGGSSLVGAGHVLHPGQSVRTERDSTARLRFSDGSDVVLRPSSQIRIDDYRFDSSRPQSDSFALRLLKGGLRTLTGAIAQRNRERVSYVTATATVGIRGTDFVMRLCEDDCASEERVAGRPRTPDAAVARLGAVSGGVSALRPDGRWRALDAGDAIYVDDAIVTGTTGVAILFFLDDTRITLQPRSILVVDDYVFDASSPRRSRAVLALVDGAARTSTGAIAKASPERFVFLTPERRVRVHGTLFETVVQVVTNAAESAGEQLSQAGQEAQDAAKTAADKTGDAAQQASQDTNVALQNTNIRIAQGQRAASNAVAKAHQAADDAIANPPTIPVPTADVDVGATARQIGSSVDAGVDTAKQAADTAARAVTDSAIVKGARQAGNTAKQTVEAGTSTTSTSSGGQPPKIPVPTADVDVGATARQIGSSVDAGVDTAKQAADTAARAVTDSAIVKGARQAGNTAKQTVEAGTSTTSTSSGGQPPKIPVPTADVDVGATARQIGSSVDAGVDTAKQAADTAARAVTDSAIVKGARQAGNTAKQTVQAGTSTVAETWREAAGGASDASNVARDSSTQVVERTVTWTFGAIGAAADAGVVVGKDIAEGFISGKNAVVAAVLSMMQARAETREKMNAASSTGASGQGTGVEKDASATADSTANTSGGIASLDQAVPFSGETAATRAAQPGGKASSGASVNDGAGGEKSRPSSPPPTSRFAGEVAREGGSGSGSKEGSGKTLADDAAAGKSPPAATTTSRTVEPNRAMTTSSSAERGTPVGAAGGISITAVQVYEGAVTLVDSTGDLAVRRGSLGVSTDAGPTRTRFDGLVASTAPNPASFVVDGRLFGAAAGDTPSAGLYTLVRSGRIAMTRDGREIVLEPGEAGFADESGGAPTRLRELPRFLDGDGYLAVAFDPSTLMCGPATPGMPGARTSAVRSAGVSVATAASGLPGAGTWGLPGSRVAPTNSAAYRDAVGAAHFAATSGMSAASRAAYWGGFDTADLASRVDVSGKSGGAGMTADGVGVRGVGPTTGSLGEPAGGFAGGNSPGRGAAASFRDGGKWIGGQRYGGTFAAGRRGLTRSGDISIGAGGGTGDFRGGGLGNAASGYITDVAKVSIVDGAPIGIPFPAPGGGPPGIAASKVLSWTDFTSGLGRTQGDEAGRNTGAIIGRRGDTGTVESTVTVYMGAPRTDNPPARRERDDTIGKRERDDVLGGGDVIVVLNRADAGQMANAIRRQIGAITGAAGGAGDGRTDQQTTTGGGPMIVDRGAQADAKRGGTSGGAVSFETMFRINQYVNPGAQ